MRWTILPVLFSIPILSIGQTDVQPDASRIKLKLKKLNVLVSVLYVAAHPDDENTQLITLMSNGKLAATAYLSMTRGDGGQNLIGSEIRDELGLIRTQELLSARRIDGGKQFFTRANDFGFSKSAEETFRLWDKESILSDVVKVYRQVQPDVIITRFPADERAGHGQHTASAILAREAFDMAANPSVYTDQLKELKVWPPKRLYLNTGVWWNKTVSENTPGIITVNIGEFSPLLGTSYSEIASLSSSQHKSQGYGQRGSRGNDLEFLEYVTGEKATKDIFEGINTTWGRLKNSEKVQELVDKAIREFNEEDPSASVRLLFEIRKEIRLLEESVWKTRKLTEVEQLIQDCLGLYVSMSADRYWSSPTEEVTVSVEIVNRSSLNVSFETLRVSNFELDTTTTSLLKNNVALTFNSKHKIASTSYSDPYWLRQPHGVGKFTVSDSNLIGKPENDPAVSGTFQFRVEGETLTITKALIYRWADPVKGELTRPFSIVPQVFLNLPDKVLVFSDGQPHTIDVKIISASTSDVKGELKLNVPVGWRIEPASIPFSLDRSNPEGTKQFTIYPSSNESTASLLVEANIGGKKFNQSLRVIAYDHIPTQTLLPTASAKLVRIDLKKEGSTIGFIRGAGDETPAALRTMGYEVWEMKDEEVTRENLRRVDGIVLGVRALNVNQRFPYMVDDLLEYVKGGGTMVVQYNTKGEFEKEKFAPYPLTLSRGRVTEEESEVRILKPNHPLLNKPNKITAADFTGWVQERGLNFPDKWDPAFEALLSMSDTGTPPMDGSILVAPYGQGRYIYTSISFFRQLPEGVAGAYKLFANLVSPLKSHKAEAVTTKSKSK